MLARATLVAFVCGMLMSGSARADIESGPAAGSEVKPFPVFSVTGVVENKEANFVKTREGKPTIWYFVTADKWSRPNARLLRTLDKQRAKAGEDAHVVAVWLTEDAKKSKEYMTVLQNVLKLEGTSLTVYEKHPQGPIEWSLNTDAAVTVVTTQKGKVLGSFPYESVNATVAKEILGTFKQKPDKAETSTDKASEKKLDTPGRE